jgi:hypothetical protein
MGLRINIPLPGPFSYSARVTPPIGRTVRSLGRAGQTVARDARCREIQRGQVRSRARQPAPPVNWIGWVPLGVLVTALFLIICWAAIVS